MDFNKLGAAVAVEQDLTVEHSGFVRELPRAGITLCRLRDYIELGRHEPNNPTYKPSLKVILTFELLHPDHMIEMGGVKRPATIAVRVNKTFSDKGKYMPLFKLMNRACNNRFNHFAQMIGQPFLAEVTHSEYKGKQYANLDIDGVYTFKAPQQIDALSGTVTQIPVPELDGTPKCFLWEVASLPKEDVQEMWDSLFIDGQRDDGTSKNWIQDNIKSAIDWDGSMTQSIVDCSVDIDELGIGGDDAFPF